MAAPSPKQRAVTMKRNGMDDSLVGAVLGISAADVRSLLYDADPDVQLGGVVLPTTPSIPVDPPVDNLVYQWPSGDNVNEWADLEHRTAPTDAPAYLFQLTAALQSFDFQDATVIVYGGGEQAFNDWYVDGGPSPPPMVQASIRTRGESAFDDKVLERFTLHLYVAAGAEIGLFRRDESNLENGSSAGWEDACWIPLV